MPSVAFEFLSELVGHCQNARNRNRLGTILK
jgi:hypothetical protein